MSVYVDTAIHPLRDRLMCHMFSPDLEELHAMAQRIGIERRWFQDPERMTVSWPHYDIDKPRRSLAVSFGALECDKYQTVAMAAIIQGRPDKLLRIYSLADPFRPFAPAAHVPEWLARQGFPQAWTWPEPD
jgi:hypothetical protein